MISFILAAAMSTSQLTDLLNTNFAVTSYKESVAEMREYASAPGGYQHHACTISRKAKDASYELKSIKLNASLEDPKALDREILQAERDADYYQSICDQRR